MQKTSKNSFVLYHNFFNQIVLLDMQARGELITAIYQYETCGELTMELSPMVMMAFSFIKDSLDRDRKAYEARVEANRENGKKGGRPKNSQSEITHSVYAKPKKADNDNDNGNDNENEIDNVTVKERDVRKKEKEKRKKESEGFSDDSVVTDAPLSDAPRLNEQDKKYLIGRGISRQYIESREERAARFAKSQNKHITTVFLEWWQSDGGKLGVVDLGTQLPNKPLGELDDEEFMAYRILQQMEGYQ